jgi:hypothetical protein
MSVSAEPAMPTWRGYQSIDRFDISQSPADLNIYEKRLEELLCRSVPLQRADLTEEQIN